MPDVCLSLMFGIGIGIGIGLWCAANYVVCDAALD
jgi:hypothetical protein